MSEPLNFPKCECGRPGCKERWDAAEALVKHCISNNIGSDSMLIALAYTAHRDGIYPDAAGIELITAMEVFCAAICGQQQQSLKETKHSDDL